MSLTKNDIELCLVFFLVARNHFMRFMCIFYNEIIIKQLIHI